MINEIIQREWNFFQEVNNIGGPAQCQRDNETFVLQRTAQFESFDEEVLESYLQDLKDYQSTPYNPLANKYAYMMRSTDPEYFKTIEDQLPQLDDAQKDLIEIIVAIEVTMREELNEKYPTLSLLSRYTYTSQDTKEDTSFETYLRGELSTYSPHTLYLYGKMIMNKMNNNINFILEILERTVKAYGYSSIEEANAKHSV